MDAIKRNFMTGIVRVRARTASAFTLIELLVVVAIIGLLAALLLPALQRAAESARTAVCRSHIKQYGYAMAIYVGDSDGFFSPTYVPRSPRRKQYAEFIFGYDDYVGTTMDRSKTKILQCPSWNGEKPFLTDGTGGFYMYSYNYNHNYLGRGAQPVKATKVGNPATTLLFGEPGYVYGFGSNMAVKGAVSMTAPFYDRAGAVPGGGAGTVYLRHLGETATNAAWVDGHATTIEEKDTTPARTPYCKFDGPGTTHPDFPNVRYIGTGNDDLYDLE